MIEAITQRRNSEHGGSDVLEVSYLKYFSKLGATLIPISNNAEYTKRYFDQLKIDGIILSGGGDIQPILYGVNLPLHGDYSPERDETEKTLLEIAIEQDLPVLGICRGMQAINVNFGGKLIQKIETDFEGGLNHKETRHNIKVFDDLIVESLGTNTFEVNSHHDHGISRQQLSSQLRPFAFAEDQTIEGFYHPEHAIAGIMWHPERESSQHALNELLTKSFLSRELYWSIRKGNRNER